MGSGIADTVGSPDRLLRRLYQTAVAAAQPEHYLPPALPRLSDLPHTGRLIVVGAGKAAAAMAQCAEQHWRDDPRFSQVTGLVIARHGEARPTRHIEIVEAAHPVPDKHAVAATERIVSLLHGAGPEDRVLCLLSGGGSALLCLPATGIGLTEKQNVTRALLASGAPIDAINCVRKHLSAVKGGRLAQAAWPAPVLTLAVSDVVGDDPSVIASGPTVPDPSTSAMARAIVARHCPTPPASVLRYLGDPRSETPKPGDAIFTRTDYRILMHGAAALAAAATDAEQAGCTVINLGAAITGEARAVAHQHAQMARACMADAPTLILSGGELTVRLGGQAGHGGPNLEYALALAIALNGVANIWALAADTDGIDGTAPDGQPAAGAIVTPETVARARRLGIDTKRFINHHDSYDFFDRVGGLIRPGPTGTNVNDLRAILILPTR